jgi:hypothetical protein
MVVPGVAAKEIETGGVGSAARTAGPEASSTAPMAPRTTDTRIACSPPHARYDWKDATPRPGGWKGLAVNRHAWPMSSDLHAFVVRPSEASREWAERVGVHAVPLSFGLALIPITDRVLDGFGGKSDRFGDFYNLSSVLAEWGRLLSYESPVAYVYEESFGGPGLQEVVGWRDGAVAFGPRFTSDAEEDDRFEVVEDSDLRAINQVLRWLGVEKGTAFDEFEAAGLNQERHTEDWERQGSGEWAS